MAKTDSISVQLLSWRKFNPRSDVKRPSWFRVECALMEDPDFYDFTHEEFKAWLYLMAHACKKNSDTVRVNFAHAEATARLSRKGIEGALFKLMELQLVAVDVTCANASVTSANASGTRTNATLQDRTGQTGQDKQDRTPASAVSLPPLAEIWNEKTAGRLARVQSVPKSGTRRKACEERWRENPSPEHWTEVIERISRSPFCLGDNERRWKADFDFLIRPDTAAKVLEGKYDARPSINVTPIQLVDPALKAELDEFDREIEKARQSLNRGPA